MDKIAIMIVDDHTIVRKGILGILRSQPDFRVVAEAENGLEAIKKTATYRPDVILMDINMPVMDGLEATARISQAHPQIKIVILSMHNDESFSEVARKAGAACFLSKDARPLEIFNAIREVHGRVNLHLVA